MADGIYVGMAAAAARAEQLDAVADNLANVETPGFKASYPAFQSFLPPRAGATSDKVAAAAVGTGASAAPGPIMRTDNPLDIVPNDAAFLMVRTATGPAYTRNGKLILDADGTLTSAGRPVIGAQTGEPISVPPGSSLTIDERGAILVDRREVDRLALFQMQGGLVHLGSSLYGPAAGAAAQPVEAGVSVGQLEMGNATALDATVQMIGAQRQFETAMQAIQTYRRLDDRAIEVGKSK